MRLFDRESALSATCPWQADSSLARVGEATAAVTFSRIIKRAIRPERDAINEVVKVVPGRFRDVA